MVVLRGRDHVKMASTATWTIGVLMLTVTYIHGFVISIRDASSSNGNSLSSMPLDAFMSANSIITPKQADTISSTGVVGKDNTIVNISYNTDSGMTGKENTVPGGTVSDTKSDTPFNMNAGSASSALNTIENNTGASSSSTSSLSDGTASSGSSSSSSSNLVTAFSGSSSSSSSSLLSASSVSSSSSSSSLLSASSGSSSLSSSSSTGSSSSSSGASSSSGSALSSGSDLSVNSISNVASIQVGDLGATVDESKSNADESTGAVSNVDTTADTKNSAGTSLDETGAGADVGVNTDDGAIEGSNAAASVDAGLQTGAIADESTNINAGSSSSLVASVHTKKGSNVDTVASDDIGASIDVGAASGTNADTGGSKVDAGASVNSSAGVSSTLDSTASVGSNTSEGTSSDTGAIAGSSAGSSGDAGASLDTGSSADVVKNASSVSNTSARSNADVGASAVPNTAADTITNTISSGVIESNVKDKGGVQPKSNVSKRDSSLYLSPAEIRELVKLYQLQPSKYGQYLSNNVWRSNKIVRSMDNFERLLVPVAAFYQILMSGTDCMPWMSFGFDNTFIWQGGRANVHILGRNGRSATVCLGNPLLPGNENCRFQVLVPAGYASATETPGFALFNRVAHIDHDADVRSIESLTSRLPENMESYIKQFDRCYLFRAK